MFRKTVFLLISSWFNAETARGPSMVYYILHKLKKEQSKSFEDILILLIKLKL